MRVNTLTLSEKLFERYELKHNRVFHYFGLLAYYALAQVGNEKKDDVIIEKCKKYLNQYPDNFKHPQYSFEVYRVGGSAKAWMFMKGYMPHCEKELRKYAEMTLKEPLSKEGILCLKSDNRCIWIDTVSSVVPFMLFMGNILKEQRYIDFAAEQCFKSYDIFMDKTCGLLHQGKGFMENPDRISQDHWGRGNGWGYLALSEMLQYLPSDSVHWKKAEEYYIAHTDALIEHQTERGLWRQEIPHELSWYESSGTGLILYGIGIGLRLGILKEEKYRQAFENGIAALAKYCITKEYATLLSCPSCRCPGKGKEKGSVKAYLTEVMPETDERHSYGCIMLAFVEAYRNGITETEIQD